jgi:hypothetical protein
LLKLRLVENDSLIVITAQECGFRIRRLVGAYDFAGSRDGRDAPTVERKHD